MNRISQLEQFLREDPHDPFNIYALALEYLKIDNKKSYSLFQKLFEERPDYLPTYYPFAHLLSELQQFDKAELIFKQGIEKARDANDLKTLKELTNAYNDWLFDR